jgi:hypothetical protein
LRLREHCPSQLPSHFANGLAAELAQMVIGMEVSPAHPVFAAEVSKDRMRSASGIGARAEPIDCLNELSAVAFKFDWRSAAGPLLHFRHCRRILWPGQGRAQGDPLEDRLRDGQSHGGDFLLADYATITVSEMAKHLVRGHRAPTPGRV